MIEVIVRETKEVQIEDRRIRIITEESICSFKRNYDFNINREYVLKCREKSRDFWVVRQIGTRYWINRRSNCVIYL